MLNYLISVQNPLKMYKIGRISIRDFALVRFTKCVINFAFFNFFFMKFSDSNNQCKVEFLPIGIFDFGLTKNLAPKFQNFSGNPSYDAYTYSYFSVYIFWATFGPGKWVWPWPTRAPLVVWGLQT